MKVKLRPHIKKLIKFLKENSGKKVNHTARELSTIFNTKYGTLGFWLKRFNVKTRGRIINPICKRGHDKRITGKYPRGQCKACVRTYVCNWKTNNRDHARNTYLKRIFGISLDDYNFLFKKQKKRCAICKINQNKLHRRDKRNNSLYVDHDHRTGKVRGLLCVDCNRGLGSFRDCIENLKNAIKYLR